MTLQQMKKELNMQTVPVCFSDIFSEIADSFEERATLVLSDSYITKTLIDCHALSAYTETVLAAAKKVRENEAMRLLVCLLEKWVRAGGNANDISYTPPCGQGIEYDFIHLFAAIPTMPDSVKYMRDRGVSEEIIAATMQEYDYCFEMCLSNIGRIAFDRGRLGWIRLLIQNKLLRIGRFKYELPTKRVNGARVYKNKTGGLAVFADGLHMHRNGGVVGSIALEDEEGSFFAEVSETDDEIIGHIITDGCVEKEKTSLPKSEWELCLSKDDPVIPVHIPSDGSFDTETVESSYRQLREVMAKSYPDMPYKAFHCCSWMMSRDLRKVLKETSNILAFQDKYIHYPCKSAGTWVFKNVFPGEGGISDIENLSETTSLQRGIKELYKNGGYIYDDCGFFF